MAFRLRREQNLERIRTLLDLSETALPVMWFSLALLLAAGLGADSDVRAGRLDELLRE